MSSELDICNMALSHLGVSVEIQDLAAERSKEAQACRRFYEPTRDEVLRDFDWSFARRREALAKVADDPDTYWSFSYRRPANALAIRSLPNDAGIRIDTSASRVVFSEGSDATGELIFTDQIDAEVIYTVRETNAEKFPPDFVHALSLLLASKIGPRVAGGDQFKLADRAFGLYRLAIQKAQANAANENARLDPEPDAEMVRIRE
jgi:hypothetical protein